MDRRLFLRSTTALGGALIAARQTGASEMIGASTNPAARSAAPWWPASPGRVSFVRTRDRSAGVRRALELLEFESPRGKDLFLKPNFNSAHRAPGSTHNETLAAVARYLEAAGADRLALGDRSGMGDTRGVMESKEIFRLADELGIETVVFDELPAEDWRLVRPPESHWEDGFAMPRRVFEADGVVQTCCLKTHQYGGHFTMSLKNSVGLAAKTLPGEGHNYMRELHRSPHMRRMIAELNTAYAPDVVLLDGVEAFVTEGPAEGKRVDAEVIMASTDRVALDAVGVAVLRHYGTTPEVSAGPVFEQEQIARAVELGLGVSRPEEIELVTDDPESAAYADRIRDVLLA